MISCFLSAWSSLHGRCELTWQNNYNLPDGKNSLTTSLHVVSWFVYLQPRFTSTRDVAADGCCLLLNSWIWIIWGVMVQRCLTCEQDLCVFLTGRLLSVVLWRGPSAAAADQVSIDSFIIERRWKMIPGCRPLACEHCYCHCWEILLHFQHTNQEAALNWKVCVCVCASVLSMGTDEINGVQSGGLRPDHLLCRWSICERCSGCFWPFLSLRVWKKSEVTRRWQTHLRVWSLSMRRQEHLSGDNETVSPGESALSVTLSCLYHLYLQRAHANKSEWSRDELSVHQAELLKSVVSVSVDVIGPAVVERCSRIFSLE